MDTSKWSNDSWEVIDAYFNNPKQLLRHQIDSYNEFVKKGIVEIVRQFSPIQISGENKTYLMHLEVYQLVDLKFKNLMEE